MWELLELLGMILLASRDDPKAELLRRERRAASLRRVLGVVPNTDIRQPEYRNRLRELGYDVDE